MRFTPAEEKEFSQLLLGRLKEVKDKKEIAAVLALCSLSTANDGAMAAALVEVGLVAPLMEVLKSNLDQVDVVERGLFTVGWISYGSCKDWIGCGCVHFRTNCALAQLA
mgnify:CR=1 FL=1